MTKYFMGISTPQYNSTAALIDKHGNVICIRQEESRQNIKNNMIWPQTSINQCLNYASANNLDLIDNLTFGYYEKPWLKFSRRLYQNPMGLTKYLKEATIISFLLTRNTKTISHHKSHALTGCATAPFDNGVYLIADIVGEWNTTSWGTFDKITTPKQHGSIKYPHSIGLLYSAFTRYIGLTPNRDEHIVMSSSVLGKPTKVHHIWSFVKINKNGTYSLTKNLYNGIEQYLNQPIPIDDWYDWCASIQQVFEEVMSNLVWMMTKKYGNHINLVLGGECASNWLNNTRILKEHSISDIWTFPCPGDSGSAIGAAAHAADINNIYWPNSFTGIDIDNESNPTQSLIRDIVGRLEAGQIVGWIQGKKEFGSQSLGHRALLADPRRNDMIFRIDKIFHRPIFKSFVPAVLEEDAFMYFDMPCKENRNNYIQFVSRVRNPESLPAICYQTDNFIKIQTVPKSTDSFRRLLEHWKESTGCSVLLNTDFKGETHSLINERQEAIHTLLNTPMDALVIGNRLYYKTEKVGLSDEPGETIEIAECIDYSNGADNIIRGKF